MEQFVPKTLFLPSVSLSEEHIRYSNTTVYCGIHERSECIPVDSGITNLIHDRCSCVYFTLGSRDECGWMCPLKFEQARHKRDSGLWDVNSLCLYIRDRKKK